MILVYSIQNGARGGSRLAEGKVDFLALVLKLLRLALVLVRPKELVLDVAAFKRLRGKESTVRWVHSRVWVG